MADSPIKFDFQKFCTSLKPLRSFSDVQNFLQETFRVNVNLKVFGQALERFDDSNSYIESLSEGFDAPQTLADGKPVSNPVKTIFPIFTNENFSAVLEVYSSDNSLLDLFKTILPVIELKIENILLIEKVKKDFSFHNAMTGIAKIVETQYDYEFILPIIGEILDTFIDNHLVYIFLENNGKNELVWPSSCLDKEIVETISSGNLPKETLISQNGKISYVPLISENKTIGYIVTKSTSKPVTATEIYYLEQLATQVATTVARANVFFEILKYATLDALTGLYNRHQLDTRLKQETSVAKRKNSPLCAIMTDIDFFKKVNDTYGHACGDLVLKEVAKVMRGELREYDIAGRYGGEEFVFLLPDTSKAEACMVAERLRDAVKKKVIDITEVNSDGAVKSISVTVSIGVSEYNGNLTAEEFIMNTDKALYQAKTSGRNTIKIF